MKKVTLDYPQYHVVLSSEEWASIEILEYITQSDKYPSLIKGSDGLMINYLTNPEIVSYEYVEEGWSVRSLLNQIANAEPPFHALIDTGALITGMTNFEVSILSRNFALWSWFVESIFLKNLLSHFRSPDIC